MHPSLQQLISYEKTYLMNHPAAELRGIKNQNLVVLDVDI